MSRRRVHKDVEHLADQYPKLCRDVTAWGEARAVEHQMRSEWGSLDRVTAQLYHLGLSAKAIGRVLHLDNRNVYRELHRWAKRTGVSRVVRSEADLESPTSRGTP